MGEAEARGDEGRQGGEETTRATGRWGGDKGRRGEREGPTTMIGRERGPCRGHASLLRYYGDIATLLHCSCHIARATLLLMALLLLYVYFNGLLPCSCQGDDALELRALCFFVVATC